jgi:hypothetical protein
MTLPATFATLLIAASAALLSAPAAVAAPLAGPLSLGEAAATPIVQVRHTRRSHRGYRAYGYRGYGAFARRGCVHGTPGETSAYPSWMVCHRR